MSDATDAIVDVVEALDEYGTDIVLRTVTEDSYNPHTGPTNSNVDKPLKAFIKEFASHQLSQQFSKDTYDLAISTYDTSAITKTHKILYGGQEYNIVYVSSKVLQNETIIYELLIAR